jgi:tetratricopeptide (TPR) repeat protein
MTYPAVQLFAQRAQAANPAFAVTDANARDVTILCGRLDGLPLAIELAASLTAAYSPATLVRRLEERAALPGTLRDLPERQRSLENVVAWSEALLTPGEQVLFQLVGVFDGGFSLGIVQQVWQGAHKDANPEGANADLLGLLGALVQRSLVQRDDAGGDEPRFRLLETIRVVTAERLRSGPDRDRVYAAHAAAMQHAAERAQLERRDADFDARLRRLERDLPNLRVALGWLTAHDLAGAARLLDSLGSLWSLCGYGAEGLEHCEAVLARYTEQDLLRCRLLRHAAWIATNLGELSRAEQHVAEAYRLADALRDEREMAFVRFVRGNIAQGVGRATEAEAEIESALQVLEELGKTWATFASHAVLGMVALDRGDAALAEARYQTALRSAATDIAARDRATALCNVAVAQRWQGKLDDAATHAARALALAEGIVAWTARAGAWQVLARVSLEQGDLEAARVGFQESLRHWQRSGDQRGLAACLEATAVFAVTCGSAGKAATLLAAVAALREQVGPASILAAAECDSLAASLRGTLGSTAFVIAEERGRMLSLMQALALAHEILGQPA